MGELTKSLSDVTNIETSFNITKPFTSKENTVIGKRKYFTDNEVKIVFNYIYQQMNEHHRQTHARYALLFMTQLFTGARVGEVLELTPKDIDIQNNTITLITLKTRKDIVPTRTMQLNPKLKDVWTSYALEFKIPIRSYDKIFNLTEQGINKYTARITKAVGFSVHSHKFRHTFGHKCDESGFTVAQIQALMGHSSLRSTSEYLKYIGTEIDLSKMRWNF